MNHIGHAGFRYPNHQHGDCIVSDSYKFIYINIPRVASKTIKITLEKTHCKLNNLFRIPDLSKYFIFTFVRNPVNRIWSARARLMSNRYYGAKYKPDVQNIDRMLDKIESEGFFDVHFLPQTEFLKDLSGNYFNIDYIGIIDSLRKDITNIKAKLKLPEAHIPHEHRTKSRMKFTDKQVDRIKKLYRESYNFYMEIKKNERVFVS